jgi:hypothetical protein
MNENSARFGLSGQQINVQFAIENSLILKKREERIQVHKKKSFHFWFFFLSFTHVFFSSHPLSLFGLLRFWVPSLQ